MLTPQQVDSLIDEKLARKSKSTVWFNPEKNAYYKANNPTINDEPQYDQYICSGLTVGNGLKTLKGASANLSATEIDKARFSGVSKEFADEANGFWNAMDKVKKNSLQGLPLGAGVITQSDYSTIANVVVDATTLELLARDFVLEDAVTRKSSQKLVYTADNITPYLNEPDVGENDVMPPRSISYSRFQITLKKAQGHVKASRWAEMAIRDHDVIADNFRIIDADFPRIFSAEIATQLSGLTDIAAGTLWTLVTAGNFHSDVNPTGVMLTNTATIRTAGGMSNTLVMNSKAYQAMVQNTYFRISGGFLGTMPSFEGTSARVRTHPMLPGYQIYVDELCTANNVFQYDKRAIEFITGPTRTATINDDYGNFTAQVHDRWYGSGTRVPNFGREITGVTS